VAVTDEAIEKIKAMIVSGQLQPGQRLPREADLAARLGLSRNSLREAVRALARVCILDVRQGDGTYVASLAADSLIDGDLEFHRRLAAAAGNSVLSSLIDSLSGPTQRARIWRGLTQEGALARTLAEHHSIFRAIRGRDPELARTWAMVHIAGVEEWLRSTLQG
jgi:GntR family transcriptional regulator, transcriptional repressor for pyruvate dehydrogenase complex